MYQQQKFRRGLFLLLGFLLLTTSTLLAQDTYRWVGGTDNNWHTLANWTVNGVTPSQVPDGEDDVIFDGVSDVRISIRANAACRNFTTMNSSNLRFKLGSTNFRLLVTGNITFDNETTFEFFGAIRFFSSAPNASTPQEIRLGDTNEHGVALEFAGSGTKILETNIKVGAITLQQGTFLTNEKSIQCGTFNARNGESSRILDMRNSNITTGFWEIGDPDKLELRTAGSNLTIERGSVGGNGVILGNQAYDRVILGTTPAKLLNLSRNINTNISTIHTLTLRSSATSRANYICDHLIIEPGVNLFLTSNLIVKNEVNAEGTCAAPITLRTRSGSLAPALVLEDAASANFTSNFVQIENLRAQSNTTIVLPNGLNLNDVANVGGNVIDGWQFNSPTQQRNLVWVGGRQGSATRNWSDTRNWVELLADGTTQPTCGIPSPLDNVFFRADSFDPRDPANVTDPDRVDNDVVLDILDAHCKSMTWDANLNLIVRPVLKSGGAKTMFVHGSLQLANGMDLETTVGFQRSTTFHLKGNDSGLLLNTAGKELQENLHIDGTGSYTLVGNLKVKKTLWFDLGNLDATGKIVEATIVSDERKTGAKTFDISNGELRVGRLLRIVRELDFITTNATIRMLAENKSEFYVRHVVNFHDVIFDNPNDERALFRVNPNAVFNEVTVNASRITIQGAKEFKKLDLQGSATFAYQASRTYQELILTGGKSYTFDAGATPQTHIIENKLTAIGTCGTPVILATNEPGKPAVIQFNGNSSNDSELVYLYINEVNATIPGNTNPEVNVRDGLDIGTTSADGWDISSTASPRTLYWVGKGDSNNWGDEKNWSNTSGGINGSDEECIPNPTDTVIFDNNSFTATNNEVVMNLAVATCADIRWENTTQAATWSGDFTKNILRISGSFTMADPAQVNVTYKGEVYMVGEGTHTIDIKNNPMPNTSWIFDSPGATWNLSSGLHVESLILNAGTLNTQGNSLSMTNFKTLSDRTRGLTLGNSQVTVRGAGSTRTLVWEVRNSATFALNAGQSTITVEGESLSVDWGIGLTYNNLILQPSGGLGPAKFTTTANETTFGDVVARGLRFIFKGNNNTYRRLSIEVSSESEGSHTYDTLLLQKGLTHSFESGTTQTIRQFLQFKGDNCATSSLRASGDNAVHFEIVDGPEGLDRVLVRFVNIEGVSITDRDPNPKYRAIQSASLGDQNTGWDFSSTQAGTQGLGPDATIPAGGQICLNVDNFGVVPGEDTFTWFKDGVALSHQGRELCVGDAEAGTYRLVVFYGGEASCSVEDEIVLSAPENICKYEVGNATFTCVGDVVCVWLKAKIAVDAGIIGMDYCLQYDAEVMEPVTDMGLPQNQRYEFGEVVTTNGNNLEDVYLNYVAAQSRVYASIFYNESNNTGSPRYFEGAGNVFCIKFRLKKAINGQFPITVCQVSESYALGQIEQCADPGVTEVTEDVNRVRGRVIYWNQANGVRPLSYNNGTDELFTNIYGNNESCDSLATTSVNTDNEGYFVYDRTQGSRISIQRDIPGDFNNQTGQARSLMSVVNGMDCYYAGLITTFNQNDTQKGNANWQPNAFQMLAADVNMNDQVRANDITLIQNRIVLKIKEFPQVWNYDYSVGNTNPIPRQNGLYSLDWRFVDETTANNEADFKIAANYPVYLAGANDTGFWRDNVPNLTTCRPVYDGSVCDSNNTNNLFYGILLGDIDGNWNTQDNSNLRTTQDNGTLIIDVFNAQNLGDNVYRIPVYYRHDQPLNAIDFRFNYDHNKLEIQQVSYAANGEQAGLRMAWNAYQQQQFLLTSYTMDGVNTKEHVYYLEVKTKGETLSADDFLNTEAYLNGRLSQATVITNAIEQNKFTTGSNGTLLTVYPNPAKDQVTLSFAPVSNQQDKYSVVITDLSGQRLSIKPQINEQGKVQFGVTHLTSGVYLVNLYDAAGQVVAREKLMIKR
ncbi:MAG TPA: hypothetical protein DCS93_24550 [Microscillaceae bacterium]|nr:hypothetical protein [Microscillaceae bacterium]